MRKTLLWLATFFSLVLVESTPAFALSIDNETGLNTDGSAKYTDPDDKQPSLLNTPLTPPGEAQGKPNGTMQIAPGASFSFSGGPANGQQPNQDAFDHAYAHFGN